MAARHGLKEQHCAVLADGNIADLIDHEQRWMSEDRNAAFQCATRFGFSKIPYQVGKSAAVHTPAILCCGNGKACSEIRLSNTRWADKADVLVSLAKKPSSARFMICSRLFEG